jgi:two-component system, OmpR family, response regulator
MRIMIVEDDAALARGVARLLESEGYAVDVVARGERAILAAEQERFDLVILDVGLPGMDGFEVLRRLRAHAQRVPVLLLTARDAVDDRVHGLDLGADDYVAKPFAMSELTARVRALIREWAVLEVLLAKVERVVSKEAIIQAVANWGEELSLNAIEVYVSRLRAKLEPAGIRIRTVRGFGYMLEEHRAG